MRNYGQVIHKIIQRGNSHMAAMSKDVTLYGFWASSATWRVRAALVYKNLNYDEVSINIVGKDESWVDYQQKINPMGFVPSVKLHTFAGERVFTESLPILELIEESFPDTPKLLPNCSMDRHRMRVICETINAGMQPLQNLSTLRELGLEKEHEKAYVKKMMLRGVSKLESIIDGGGYCLGDSLTMADLFFVPQMRNVVDRFGIDISEYQKCDELYKTLQNHEIFVKTHPKNQPGAGIDPVSGK